MPEKEIVKLELLEIQQKPAENGVEDVLLRTNDGIIPCRFHGASNSESAVLWAAGSTPEEPASGLYERLAGQLAPTNIASLRLDYRKPGEFINCVLDVLLGIGFLRNQGVKRVALVGHSFGGSVVINAGVASPAVVAVAALSSQMTGADDIVELSPKPVLLMHGSADEVRSEIGTQQLYDLAGEPKQLILYPDCGHNFDECSAQVERDLLAWLHRVMAQS